jgi:hypothetical protein
MSSSARELDKNISSVHNIRRRRSVNETESHMWNGNNRKMIDFCIMRINKTMRSVTIRHLSWVRQGLETWAVFYFTSYLFYFYSIPVSFSVSLVISPPHLPLPQFHSTTTLPMHTIPFTQYIETRFSYICYRTISI